MKRIVLLITAWSLASAAHAQTAGGSAVAVPATPSPLDQLTSWITFTKPQTLADAFYNIGRTYGLAFVVEPDVIGPAELDLPAGSTVRQVLDSLIYPLDLHYEVDGSRIIIKRTQTVSYQLYVPSNTRTSSSQTNITLASSSQGTNNNLNGGPGGNVPPTNSGTNTSGAGSGGGSSNVSIVESNENAFWDLILADIKVHGRPTEKFSINPNSGKLVIETGPRRQKYWRQYVDDQNEVLTRQVDIDARILSVTVNDQHKFGVDLNLASVKAGNVTINGGSTTTGISSIGPQILSGNTAAVSVTAGKVTALITALGEQGDVRTIAKPQIRVMNNQMAYLVVGQEEGFFRIDATQQIQTGNGQGIPVGTESAIYSKEMLTFGTIFSVTPYIPTHDQIILDVKPERSSLVRTKSSPDGRQDAAVTNVEKAGTRLMLADGETVILAGLSETLDGTRSRGVPGASKIPVLGRLFRTDAKAHTRSELVIIITARISKRPPAPVVAQTP